MLETTNHQSVRSGKAKFLVFCKEVLWRLRPEDNKYIGRHSALILALLHKAEIIDLNSDSMVPEHLKDVVDIWRDGIFVEVPGGYAEIPIKLPDYTNMLRSAAKEVDVYQEIENVKKVIPVVPRRPEAAAALIYSAIYVLQPNYPEIFDRFMTHITRELISDVNPICIRYMNEIAENNKKHKFHAKY